MWDAAVAAALSKCPFLQELVKKHGEEFACGVVLKPHDQISPGTGRPLFEESDKFAATVSLFHGANGVLPLPNMINAQEDDAQLEPDQNEEVMPAKPTGGSSFYGMLAKAPFAAISISSPGMPGPGDWFRWNKFANRDSRQPRSRPRMHFSAAVGSAGLSAAAGCPLRKWLGPLAPMVFSNAGVLKCPDAIVQLRAVLARSQPVRQLRPQALPIKFLAVGATAALVNIPFGALREQYEKFSPGWFLAVHATIPFIAMLRKAVIMPKIAIVCTIAAAIAGQALGARMARARKEQVSIDASSALVGQLAGPFLPPRSAPVTRNRVKTQLQLVIADLTEKLRHSPAYASGNQDFCPLVDACSVKA